MPRPIRKVTVGVNTSNANNHHVMASSYHVIGMSHTGGIIVMSLKVRSHESVGI